MKKIICLLLAAVVICSLSACAKTPELKKGGDPVDGGMKVIALMNEMINSDDYGLIVLNNYDDYVQRINDIRRGDYTSPTAVYELKMDTRRILKADTDGLPEALDKYLDGSANASVAAYINSAESLDGVAVSSLFSATTTFLNNDIEENIMYLYAFGDGYPILVNLICGEDGTVRACGNFIMNMQLDPGSADGVEQFFKDAGFTDCEVTKVR